jgi:hypothetical protein
MSYVQARGGHFENELTIIFLRYPPSITGKFVKKIFHPFWRSITPSEALREFFRDNSITLHKIAKWLKRTPLLSVCPNETEPTSAYARWMGCRSTSHPSTSHPSTYENILKEKHLGLAYWVGCRSNKVKLEFIHEPTTINFFAYHN